MALFDKSCVYFMWDDVLANKNVFLADDVSTLVEMVNDFSQEAGSMVEASSEEYDGYKEYPFVATTCIHWRFAYYDPWRSVKRAFEQGKMIECRVAGSNGEWHTIADPQWEDDTEYRVKPSTDEHLATYEQLSRWLAEGYGMIKIGETIQTHIDIAADNWNATVPNVYCVRTWYETSWSLPTKEYLTSCRLEA